MGPQLTNLWIPIERVRTKSFSILKQSALAHLRRLGIDYLLEREVPVG